MKDGTIMAKSRAPQSSDRSGRQRVAVLVALHFDRRFAGHGKRCQRANDEVQFDGSFPVRTL
jgi:hypothetical protein